MTGYVSLTSTDNSGVAQTMMEIVSKERSEFLTLVKITFKEIYETVRNTGKASPPI